MALTQISTSGIKDATIATADIADDAVTADKLANAINTDIAAKAVLTGSTNNTITTVTGANAIQGEANLTYDGSNLQFNTTANGNAVKLVSTGNYYNKLQFDSGNTSAGGSLAFIDFSWDGDKVADILAVAGSDTTNKDDGHLVFRTSPSQGAIAERLRIDSQGHTRFGPSGDGSDPGWGHSSYGNTEVAIDSPTGYAVLHMRGEGGGSTMTKYAIGVGDDKFYLAYDDVDTRHNIVVQGDGVVSIPVGIELGSGTDGTATNVLDDYEEGEHTITTNSNLTAHSSYNKADYTKVGNMVTVTFLLYVQGVSGSDTVTVSLPFANRNESVPRMCQAVGNVMWKNINTGNAGLIPYLDAGSSTLKFYKLNDDASWAVLDNGDLNAADEMYVTITYKTAT